MKEASSDRKEFCGIVLAGGRSRRMGTDKADLTFNGNTFLEIQVRKLRLLNAADILVSGKNTSLPGARYVPDRIPGLGPLGGLLSCFPAISQKYALVLGVDVPLISVPTLESLLETHLSSDHDATVLCCEGRIEPLIAVYNTETAGLIEELANNKKLAMRAYIDRLHYQLYPFRGNPRELFNCNSPRDLSGLLSAADQDGPDNQTAHVSCSQVSRIP